MHLYGLNLDELIRSRPNWSLFSRLRFFEGTQLSPTSRGELNWLKMHVSGWALVKCHARHTRLQQGRCVRSVP